MAYSLTILKANLVLSRVRNALLTCRQKTLSIAYRETSVVCKRKSLFLQHGFPQPTSTCMIMEIWALSAQRMCCSFD